MTLLGIIIGSFFVVLVIPVSYVVNWHHPSDDSEHEFFVSISWIFGGVLYEIQQVIGDETEKIIRIFGFEKTVMTKKSARSEEGEEGKVEGRTTGKSIKKVRSNFRKFTRYFGLTEIKQILTKMIHIGWKTLHPVDIAYQIEFGTGNPMYTGMITGLLHSTGAFSKLNGTLVPNFIKTTLTGRGHISGNIVIGLALLRGFSLIFTIIFIGIRHRLNVIFSGKTRIFSFTK